MNEPTITLAEAHARIAREPEAPYAIVHGKDGVFLTLNRGASDDGRDVQHTTVARIIDGKAN